jgi:hypothetical protein
LETDTRKSELAGQTKSAEGHDYDIAMLPLSTLRNMCGLVSASIKVMRQEGTPENKLEEYERAMNEILQETPVINVGEELSTDEITGLMLSAEDAPQGLRVVAEKNKAVLQICVRCDAAVDLVRRQFEKTIDRIQREQRIILHTIVAAMRGAGMQNVCWPEGEIKIVRGIAYWKIPGDKDWRELVSQPEAGMSVPDGTSDPVRGDKGIYNKASTYNLETK